ncbi:hypothetical protein, partial [Flavihumibacter petaseus]|uniref:Peptidase M4 family protein n=1 Tax=Flavihumibacter petaseus NBRC 106054 TaxID=1220578 RepID=A0A0E9N6K8_9BACT
MNRPTSRQLRGYSLDPGFSTKLDTAGVNEIVYAVPWEDELSPGPKGQYFEVYDYDPASNCWYEPVDLNDTYTLAQDGEAPSEGNPKFHQQFVYTIAMKTLEHFENSLGRKIIWATNLKFDSKAELARKKKEKDEGPPAGTYNARLRLYPHAFRDANAYYTSEKKAILFGYFEAASQIQGSNLPGGVIFTCLSPDIIAHETTHALLDSIHPRFLENTNKDVAAFHEAFADIVALLQRFTITPLVEHQIARTRGNLGEYSVLGELATQFGNALQNNRGALRGAIGAVNAKGVWERFTPDPSLYEKQFECHDRGAILVATFFDAFLRLYNDKTQDLLRIASNGTGILQPGAIHPDLVKRLADQACTIAQHLLHISIRALDYCPPLDINFGDFLRALITADVDTSPRDTNGYRIALIDSFRSWGIFPDRVNTLSVESLQWAKPTNLTQQEKDIWASIANRLKDDIRHIIDLSLSPGDHREEIFNESWKAQQKLRLILLENSDSFNVTETIWKNFLSKLGLTNEAVEFEYDGGFYGKAEAPGLEVHKVRPVYRVGRENKIVEQILITLSQTIRFRSGPLEGAKFRGGCTLILNMSGNYDVEYIIYKNIHSQHRFTAQMDFQLGRAAGNPSFSESLYEDGNGFKDINIAQLHS